MRYRRKVPLLLGAATSASGLLLIASIAPAYIRSFEALIEVPAAGSRLVVGCCLTLAGLLLIAVSWRR